MTAVKQTACSKATVRRHQTTCHPDEFWITVWRMWWRQTSRDSDWAQAPNCMRLRYDDAQHSLKTVYSLSWSWTLLFFFTFLVITLGLGLTALVLCLEMSRSRSYCPGLVSRDQDSSRHLTTDQMCHSRLVVWLLCDDFVTLFAFIHFGPIRHLVSAADWKRMVHIYDVILFSAKMNLISPCN